MPFDMIRIVVLNEPTAGGIVVVPRIVAIPRAIVVEAIRRVAVHVYPRARRGFNGARQRQSQTTTVSRLLVPVLVERRLLSPTKMRKRPTRHERNALAAAPFARVLVLVTVAARAAQVEQPRCSTPVLRVTRVTRVPVGDSSRARRSGGAAVL